MKYKIKRFICACLLLGFLFAQIPLLINIYVVGYGADYILTPEEAAKENFDCVLVLGAGVWDSGPSHMLEERLNKGLEIYEIGCTDRILMSGDHGTKGYDEVNVMKDFAVDKGAVADEVFMDHAGFSTYESMYRAKEIFNVEKVIIVTQKYHLYRAIYNARKLGLDAYGVAADGQYDYDITLKAYNNARESLARCKDFVYCIFKPEPTYLGDVIPISQSGALTDDKV